MREYIKQQREQNPNFKLKPNAGSSSSSQAPAEDAGPPPGPESVEGIAVGMRCEVSPGARRGEIMFVGEVDGLKPGFWVGVKFDEPVGKSNGVVKGKTVFECMPNYGGFVRGKNTKVGDYPERDIMDEMENEDDNGTGDDDEDEL
jgi:tubulin-folding cofactor B